MEAIAGRKLQLLQGREVSIFRTSDSCENGITRPKVPVKGSRKSPYSENLWSQSDALDFSSVKCVDENVKKDDGRKSKCQKAEFQENFQQKKREFHGFEFIFQSGI